MIGIFCSSIVGDSSTFAGFCLALEAEVWRIPKPLPQKERIFVN